MQALLKRAVLITALAPSIAVAAPVRQNASNADIAAAVGDCWNAVGPNTVERAKLEARGWRAGTATGDSKPAALALTFYGKTGSNAVIMLGGAPGTPPMCTILSSVTSAQTIERTSGGIQKVLLALDSNVQAARSKESIVFLSLPRLAIVDSTGTKDKPATRIVVGYQTAEKK